MVKNSDLLESIRKIPPASQLRYLLHRLSNVKKDHFFNRIHEYDIARVLGSAAISSKCTGIINLSDDNPTSQIEVAKYAYKLLNKKLPVIQNYEDVFKSLSPMSRSFWESSRRIDNSLLKKRYGNMIFPTYKEGLNNIYKDYTNILSTKL